MERNQTSSANTTLTFKNTTRQFYHTWTTIIGMFYKLRKSEINVAAELVYKYNEIRKNNDDQDTIYAMLMSKPSLEDMREKLNLNKNNFNVILSHLRSKNFLIGSKINKVFIPNLTGDEFRLLFSFKISK